MKISLQPNKFSTFWSLLFFAALPLQAATITWDGGGDGRSWSNPTNWSGDRVPGVTDNVVLPATTATNVIYHGSQPSPRTTLAS